MAHYRLYFLDGSGHFETVREFECDSDDLALAIAEDARGVGPIELWMGGRKIKRWEAISQPRFGSKGPRPVADS